MKAEKRTVTIEGYEYEIGNPNGDECPTTQACMWCHWMKFILPCNQLCLFPKALYGNTKAYREYINSKISIKDLIQKYNPEYKSEEIIKNKSEIKRNKYKLSNIGETFKKV